jgi:hypothetical protein
MRVVSDTGSESTMAEAASRISPGIAARQCLTPAALGGALVSDTGG